MAAPSANAMLNTSVRRMIVTDISLLCIGEIPADLDIRRETFQRACRRWAGAEGHLSAPGNRQARVIGGKPSAKTLIREHGSPTRGARASRRTRRARCRGSPALRATGPQ